MTQPPPGPPPGAGGGYPVDPRYPDPNARPPAYVDPGYPPPYPPGQEPIPPRHPRRRSPILAPMLAFIGLLVVGAASLWAMTFLSSTIDDASASEPSPAPLVAVADPSDDPADPTDDPAATEPPEAVEPTDPPEDVIVGPTAPPIVFEPAADDRAEVTGTILFTRSGDIWSASGTELRRLTNSDSLRSDSSPVWSPNGKAIYFIRTTARTTSNSRPGGKYTLYVTDLMRMNANGSNKKKVYDSLIKSGGLWFSHVLQPSVGPGGSTLAVVSDGPNGSNEEVTLHLVNAKSGRMRRVATKTEDRFGHNDPAFSPDGTKIAFTYNDNQGSEGNPRIAVLSCAKRGNCGEGKTIYHKRGYANPSWSPDGALLAVESIRGSGRDIAIINAKRGDVRVELTNDGNSFAPEFSPNGDQIAYLHRDGQNIDLRVMTLDFDERGKITLLHDRAVTVDGGLDGGSTPAWFIPSSQRADSPLPPEPEASDALDIEEEPSETPGGASEGLPPPPPPGS
jgi:Tol biopolymer transport system component